MSIYLGSSLYFTGRNC